MKTKSPYTLVSLPPALSRMRGEARVSLEKSVRRTAPALAARLDELPEVMREAIFLSALSVTSAQRRSPHGKSYSGKAVSLSERHSPVAEAVKKLPEGKRALTVGMVDLGSRVIKLPSLITLMNSVQAQVGFVELRITVPSGMVKSPAHLQAWIAEHRTKLLSDDELRKLQPNLVLEDFYYFAEAARARNRVDMLVGISPDMLAHLCDDGTPEWNFHADGAVNICVISTHNLREYAAEARRPVEAAIGMLIVGQVFTTRNSHLEYHKETRGCVFDRNDVESEVVESIRGMRIEETCMMSFDDAGDGEAAVQIVEALRKLRA